MLTRLFQPKMKRDRLEVAAQEARRLPASDHGGPVLLRESHLRWREPALPPSTTLHLRFDVLASASAVTAPPGRKENQTRCCCQHRIRESHQEAAGSGRPWADPARSPTCTDSLGFDLSGAAFVQRRRAALPWRAGQLRRVLIQFQGVRTQRVQAEGPF